MPCEQNSVLVEFSIVRNDQTNENCLNDFTQNGPQVPK
jgi:hypothetical protein